MVKNDHFPTQRLTGGDLLAICPDLNMADHMNTPPQRISGIFLRIKNFQTFFKKNFFFQNLFIYLHQRTDTNVQKKSLYLIIYII